MPRRYTWPLYAGGLLGPYGSTMVTPILHEVGIGLDCRPQQVAWAITVYMIPFAGLMLVSGTLAERWGRVTTMRASLAVLVSASVLCALAPTIELFLLGRAIQGSANAFTTPLLIAIITDSTPQARLGRSLSWFSAAQAAGLAFSPLLSGLAATVTWRASFLVPIMLGVLLLVFAPADAAPARVQRARWRALCNLRLGLASAQAFLCHLGATGLTLLCVLVAAQQFGLGPAERGLVSAAFGMAGLVAARPTGHVLDSAGPLRIGIWTNVLFAGGLALTALASGPLMLTAGVFVAGAAVTGLRAVLNTLGATSSESNRGGAISLMLAMQFLGGALAPLVWLPGYELAGTTVLFGLLVTPVLGIALIVLGRRALADPSTTAEPAPPSARRETTS